MQISLVFDIDAVSYATSITERLRRVHMADVNTDSEFEDRFLSFEEAIASRAALVIVSGTDGRADGRKRFWSQLNNTKAVKGGSNRNTWAGYRMS